MEIAIASNLHLVGVAGSKLPKSRSRPSTCMKMISMNNNISCRATNCYNSSRFMSFNETSGSNKPNYYELLSLDYTDMRNIGFGDIKKAYRRMALQYHPDISPDPSTKQESTRRFVELRRAYETLSDPISRYSYDYQLGLNSAGDASAAVGSVLGMQSNGDQRRAGFSKDVWENQLSELKRRSYIRMHRRKCSK